MESTVKDNIDIHSDLKQKCDFLSEYAASLLGCGATCIRIEKNANRIAEVFGTSMNLTILPSHVIVTLWDKDHAHSYSNMIKPKNTAIDYTLNTKLSKLSWDVYDNKLSCGQTAKAYKQILESKPINKYAVLILASLANASFCRLFGGDAASMGLVFLATAAGFAIKLLLSWRHWDARVITLFASFVSAIIAACGHYVEACTTPDVALATSILYLIPGIPFINCFSDLIAGHYVSAYSRFMHATILTVCLSLGLCVGLVVMNMNFFIK